MALIKENNTIAKLNNNNYATWKFKMEMLLIKEDLYELIIQDQAPDPITAKWQKRDQQARALINLCIEDNQIIHVKYENTAKSTWDTLKKVHERSNLSSKLFLLRKLYSTKLEEGGNMNDHIVYILELIDKLRAIGENINDSHISALLLCSVPSSYDGLITALEARQENELTPEFIKGKLIDEYSRRIGSSETENENSKAYKIFNRNINRNNHRNKFCTYCKKANHFKSDCWNLKNKNSNAQKYPEKHPSKTKQKSSSCLVMRHAGKDDSLSTDVKVQTQSKCNEILEPSEACVRPKTKQNEKSDNYSFASSSVYQNSYKSNWLIDSGATSHMCNDRNFFSEINTENHSTVIVANGNTLQAKGSGEGVILTRNSDNKLNKIRLENVLYVPDLESNLISVRRATQNNCTVTFEKDKCLIMQNKNVCLEAKAYNNLYEVNVENPYNIENSVQVAIHCKNKNCIDIWHRRLGHRGYDAIKQLITERLANGIQLDNCKHENKCENCIKGKLSEMPYPKETKYRARKPLELVHSDVCGPIQTPSIGGKSYFLTFVDDYSRFTITHLISKKSEVFTKLKEYIAMTRNKFGRNINTLRTDNGGEYINKDIENYLVDQGIHHQVTVPYSPSQNGVAERKNRSLIEMTKCMLLEAGLPQKFWGEAVNAATYLQNRLPTKSNKKTPYELWTGRKPDLSHIKIFGCKAFAFVHKHKRGKLGDKAIEGIFVGYDNRSKGYRIYVADNNVTISRTVKFIENRETKEKDDKITLRDEEEKLSEEIQSTETKNDITVDEPRRSERITKGIPPLRLTYLANAKCFNEPKSWKEIEEMENSQEKQKWINATEEEMKSLQDNQTWKLVEPPEGKRVIGCKWTFKAKYNFEGKVERYKARLVAKGFNQKFGVDYDETFAPVVTYSTIRTFLAAAAYKNLNVKHVDIKTAFLHGNLEEDVYMSQPEGYVKFGEEHKVCKLNKAIYGLKQAARAWHIRIGASLIKYGFNQSKADPCLFKMIKDARPVYVILYVDDILISGNEEDISRIIKELEKEYEVKNLGEVTYYLGINIGRTKEGNFTLSQKNKIEEIIEKFNLTESKPTNTPMESGYYKLEDEHDRLPENTKYRQAVGALLYIATVTRPDISLAVSILSRRNENPRERDWNAVKRIIRYLKTTKEMKLIISKDEEPILTAYSDADWANDKSDRKSTSGNIFKLGNSPILWISRRQNCVALSSTEAEYISAASASQEIMWLINLTNDLDMPQTLPITIYEDNQSCIKLTQSEKHHPRTKHIDVKYHNLRHLKETNVINLEYCPSKQMTADILTKPLPRPEFEKHRAKLQVKMCPFF